MGSESFIIIEGISQTRYSIISIIYTNKNYSVNMLYYRFQFINEWQTSDFWDVELQTIELCGDSFNQLSIQLTAPQRYTASSYHHLQLKVA